MVLGIVSDTHLPRFGDVLPRRLREGLKRAQVTMILHAGDITDALALDLLEEIAPVVAVAGNNDGKALQKRLGERIIIDAGGARIGLVHGHAGHGRTTPDKAFNTFAGDSVDAVVFGHSHIPYRQRRNGILLFNPGSPTDKRMNPLYSYGLLDVSNGHVSARHRFYFSRAQ